MVIYGWLMLLNWSDEIMLHIFIWIMAEHQGGTGEAGYRPEEPFLNRLALAFGIKTKPGQEKMRKIIFESYK